MDETQQELSQASIPKSHQDFYVWLRSIPLGVLYTLYRHHTQRRGNLASSPPVANAPTVYPPSEPSVKSSKIILRKSVFILVSTVIFTELFFDCLYLLLRLPAMYVHFPQIFQDQLTTAYFISFVVLNLLKIIIIVHACIKWMTTVYEIRDGEIKFKNGFIANNQKTYLCRHTQEVTCRQGLFGKIFNFGSIEIYDPTLPEGLSIDSVQNPNKYADIIKKNIQRYQDPNLIPIPPLEKVDIPLTS